MNSMNLAEVLGKASSLFGDGSYYVYGYGGSGTPIVSAYIAFDKEGNAVEANFYSDGEAIFTTDLYGSCNISPALDVLGKTGSWDDFLDKVKEIADQYLSA